MVMRRYANTCLTPMIHIHRLCLSLCDVWPAQQSCITGHHTLLLPCVLSLPLFIPALDRCQGPETVDSASYPYFSVSACDVRAWRQSIDASCQFLNAVLCLLAALYAGDDLPLCDRFRLMMSIVVSSASNAFNSAQ